MANNKKYTIKTKEMVITPCNDEDIWNCDWIITVIPDKSEKPFDIGKATFAGEKVLGTIPVKVELEEQYRNKKYGTEAFKLLVDFAFGFKNIYEVCAITEDSNDKCRYALEKAGFVHRSTDKHISTFSIKKPKTSWLGFYMYIGVLCGLALGIVLSSMWVGLVIGLVAGLAMGFALDSASNKEREKVTGTKE